jgi:transcriptional regulator with PAS, ATPase and Fis domain
MKSACAAKLAEPNELLRVLIECVNDALCLLDPQSLRLIEVNQKAAALLGRPKSELLHSTLHDLVDRQSVEALRHFEDPLQGITTRQVRLVTDRGETRLLDFSARWVQARDEGALLLIICENGSRRLSSMTVSNCEREDLIETTIDFPTIIGESSQVHDVCRLVGLVAKTDTTVLVQGESGTGKELVAQAVHFHSHRSHSPLIKVNCAALTETLLESELFGHKKGSFTGAIQDRKGRFKLADRGTIILDEIGSMSLSGQAKLLRVLQEKEFEPVGDSTTVKVDVRVIAITNADLIKAIDQGSFREDLYYRLNAFPIYLPPLRERKIDIPMLARHFLNEYTISLKRQVTNFDCQAVSMLLDYSWPGNVRELENAIEYAVILEKGQTVSARSLPEKLRRNRDTSVSLKERLELVEKQTILEALSATSWVKTQAAKLLGIDRRNLSYFLHKHGIH